MSTAPAAKPPDQVLVEVERAEKVFHRGSEEIHVLQGLSLTVARGEFLALKIGRASCRERV